MLVIDPGHKYRLNHLDGSGTSELTFVKREGEKYPGNVGNYEGTNIQEVLRAIIDRVKYLDNQIPDHANGLILANLRSALFNLEERAARRHGRIFSNIGPKIEEKPVCAGCGHIGCNEHD